MTLDRLSTLPTAERNALEALLINFDQTWKPDLLPSCFEQIKKSGNDEFRRLGLSELVKIDLQRGWSSDRGKTLDDYMREFPLLGSAETIAPELILIEFEARKLIDANVTLESYSNRYPSQYEEFVRLASKQRQFLEPLNRNPPKASIETSRIGNQETIAPTNSNPPRSGLPTQFGRYEILRQLGAGAMGTVHLAHDTQLDRKVALKTPSFQSENEAEMISRFYREARAAAKLQHRNICPIYDVGEIDGQHFISMAFIQGRTMSELIKPSELPPPKTAAVLAHRLATALAEAHRHNVVHRDLKPANIMIDKKREPVVMDFGLARQTDIETRMTQSGMLLGTPAYMSPEQVRGKPDEVGPQSDIFALGVILYELLTGKLPFEGSFAQVVCQILQDDPTPPSKIRDQVPRILESICSKMMAKRREDRYQKMDDVAKAIRGFLLASKKDSNDTVAKNIVPTTNAPVRDPKPNAPITETGALQEYFSTQADPQKSADPMPANPIPKATPLRQSIAPAERPFQPQPPRKPKKLRRKTKLAGLTKWIATGLIGVILLLAAMGIVFYFSTPYGTIRVETVGDLDGLEVRVDGDKISLNDSKRARASKQVPLELKLGDAQINLNSDTNLFTLVENGEEKRLAITVGDVELASNRFTIARNKETVLRIELLADDPKSATATHPLPAETAGNLDVDRNSGIVKVAPPDHKKPIELLPVGQWVPLLRSEKQLKEWASDQRWKEWSSTVYGPPRFANGTVTLQAGEKPGRELYGKRMRLAINTDAKNFVLHVRHNKVDGFGMGEGIWFGSTSFGSTNFDRNKHELWKLPSKKIATHRSTAGSKGFANIDYVVIDGQLSVFLDGERMFGCKVPTDPPTSVTMSVRRAIGQWQDVAMMQLSKEQIAEIQRGILPDYSTSSAESGDSAQNTNDGKTQSEAEYTSLFNGADLVGWEVLGHKGWRGDNGVLIGQAPKKRSVFDSWLIRQGEFTNFDLRFDYKLGPGGNSGVFFRAVRDKNIALKAKGEFYEINLVDDTATKFASQPPNHRNGALWNRIAASPSLKLAPNQWHSMSIQLEGNHLQVWSNDQKIVDGELPPHERVGNRIGLQLHTGQVQFRDIRIRRLD